jgi:hypothetical protein
MLWFGYVMGAQAQSDLEPDAVACESQHGNVKYETAPATKTCVAWSPTSLVFLGGTRREAVVSRLRFLGS